MGSLGGTVRLPVGCRNFPAALALVEWVAAELGVEVEVRVTMISDQAAAERARTLVEQGQHGDDVYLLFDGVLRVEIDSKPVTEVGPGAIVGELALLHQGQRLATLRAMTPCRVAVVPKDRIDRQALQEVAKSRMPPGRNAKP
jgi:CRP-like cAMP-binding protein